MIQMRLPPFQNVVNTGVALLRVPDWNVAIDRVVLQLGGTFTKAMITALRLKLGTVTIFNATGARLDAINKYKGLYDHANFLTLDFTERDSPAVALGKLRGNIDLPVLKKRGFGDLYIEVEITGATGPTLAADIQVSPSQGDGNIPIYKLVYFPAVTSAGGLFPLNYQPKKADIKRLFIFYGGTDWGASTNGNVERFQVKKNGVEQFDMTCLRNRFMQQEYRKVPQSKLFVADFIADNLQGGVLRSEDALSLEFNSWITAGGGDTLHCYAEVIDSPGNS